MGQDVKTARTNLASFGFEVEVQEVSSDEPAGEVIEQNPHSGEHPPDTAVTLSVFKGDQIKIVMANLAGLTPEEAESCLRGLGWRGNLNMEDGGDR